MLLTKKYTPSIKANNALKQDVTDELKSIIYRLEKGKYDSSLEKDTVEIVTSKLKKASDALENAICTGEEKIDGIANEAKAQLKTLKEQVTQTTTNNRFESAADDLEYTIEFWTDVIDGIVTPEEGEAHKVSRTRRKLNERLDELKGIKSDFITNEKRVENELVKLEKDLEEYDNAMVEEENERKINDLYRKTEATRSKINTLTVRQSNYSACYNLLDTIYVNAKEIVEASDFAVEEIAKAKVLLNMEKLKKVAVEPDKAILILKHMDSDTQKIANKVKEIDSKVFGLNNGASNVNQEALKYKEELMRKKLEKESLKKINSSLEEDANIMTQTEENKNGLI
ncbi:MAG: hypothetical protein E7633_03175 [Ruminococcaceae bacterium]|nr:hypothetical protein [Oscillospiraceae bacterium]